MIRNKNRFISNILVLLLLLLLLFFQSTCNEKCSLEPFCWLYTLGKENTFCSRKPFPKTILIEKFITQPLWRKTKTHSQYEYISNPTKMQKHSRKFKIQIQVVRHRISPLTRVTLNDHRFLLLLRHHYKNPAGTRTCALMR